MRFRSLSQEQVKERLKRLKATVKDQPERELKTQFASAVAEIAAIEESQGGGERKKTGGHDRKG